MPKFSQSIIKNSFFDILQVQCLYWEDYVLPNQDKQEPLIFRFRANANRMAKKRTKTHMVVERRIRTTRNHRTTVQQLITAHTCLCTNDVKPDSKKKNLNLENLMNMQKVLAKMY